MTHSDFTVETAKALKAAPKGQKVQAMIDMGWTQEEINQLKFAPRSQEMASGASKDWPKINGVSTYPYTWLLTQEELQVYYNWKKDQSSTGTPRVKTVAATKSPEVLAAEQKLREKLEELGDKECLDAFNLLHPTQEMLERQAKLAKLEELKKQQEELAKELGL